MNHPDVTAALAHERRRSLLAEAVRAARAREARRPALEGAMQPAARAFCGQDRRVATDPSTRTTGAASPCGAMQGPPPP
jgi:hypothetical protein